jgi:hypothetical protein
LRLVAEQLPELSGVRGGYFPTERRSGMYIGIGLGGIIILILILWLLGVI